MNVRNSGARAPCVMTCLFPRMQPMAPIKFAPSAAALEPRHFSPNFRQSRDRPRRRLLLTWLWACSMRVLSISAFFYPRGGGVCLCLFPVVTAQEGERWLLACFIPRGGGARLFRRSAVCSFLRSLHTRRALTARGTSPASRCASRASGASAAFTGVRVVCSGA